MDALENNNENDKYYTIESVLKRDGFFVFNNDEQVPHVDESVLDRLDKLSFENLQEIQLEQPGDIESTDKEPADSVQIKNRIVEKLRDGEYEKLSKIAEDELQYDIPTIVSYLKWHMQRVAQNVIGREDIIEQLIYAILTGEHMLLLSRTGMAKSFLSNQVFSIFENVRIFSTQASKDQTPDNYFGPYDIEEFKRGMIRHNIKGSIIEANLVLLDEFFDASDIVLRSLLSVLNERKFINGAEQIEVAIHSAIATANYMRLNEVTEAVLDRFCYKAIIPEDNDMYNRLLIDQAYMITKGKPKEPETKIPFDQIIYIHNIIKNNNKKIKIELPDSVVFIKNVVINKFVSEVRKSEPEFFISPRKQAKMSDFLRACALLNNRYEAVLQDIRDMYIAVVTLNRYINVKNKDKSLKDIYLDAFEQTMSHFTATNSFQQIDFLLNIKKIFQLLRENPEKKERLQEDKGLFHGIRNLLIRLFPLKLKGEEDKLTIEALKKGVIELNPGVEEVRDLKQGILRDYKDIY